MKIKLVGKPKDAPYLTPGKVYEARPNGHCFAFISDDQGELIQVSMPVGPYPCPHARPAKWEIVE